MLAMHAIGDYGSSPVPAFLHKLWALVGDENTNDLIAWDPSGQSFHVFEQGRFSKEVLPLYFKHNNIASFIRQLNMYGFRKVTSVEHGGLKTEKDDMEFNHPYFQRDHEDLLENIKRKIATGAKGDDVKIKHDDVNKVLMDVHHLRGKQDSINTKFDTLKRENEALWREVASLRQKHVKQSQIVNKLIQFLVTIVGSGRGLGGMKRPARMPLMLHGASESEDEGMRPTKMARRQEPQNISNLQVMPTEQTVLNAGQPISTVQIQEVASSNPSGSQTNPPYVLLPTAVDSPQTKPQTVLIINAPQKIEASKEVQPDSDSNYTTSHSPYSAIVTSPPSTTDAMSPSNLTETYLNAISPDNNLNTSGTINELDLSSLDTNIMACSSYTNVDNNKQCNEIDISDPILQAFTQSMTTNSSTAVAVSPHHNTVNTVADDVDTIHESLEDLRGLLGTGGGINIDPNSSLFGFPLDRDTLHGLFTPEAPVPPTPESLMNLGGQDEHDEPDYSKAMTNSDNQVVQYIPSDDFGSLFDLDLDSAAEFVPELSSLQTESENLSTPVYNLTSPLAERRKSRQGTSATTTTEEVD